MAVSRQDRERFARLAEALGEVERDEQAAAGLATAGDKILRALRWSDLLRSGADYSDEEIDAQATLRRRWRRRP